MKWKSFTGIQQILKDGKSIQNRRFLQLGDSWIKILAGCCCGKLARSFFLFIFFFSFFLFLSIFFPFYSHPSFTNQQIQERGRRLFATSCCPLVSSIDAGQINPPCHFLLVPWIYPSCLQDGAREKDHFGAYLPFGCPQAAQSPAKRWLLCFLGAATWARTVCPIALWQGTGDSEGTKCCAGLTQTEKK